MAGVVRSRGTDGVSARDEERLRRYREYLDFYEGRHFARPRRGRTNLVLNYARAVVDKGVSYLLGRGVTFGVEPETPDQAEETRARRAAALLREVYEENALDAVDLQAAINGAVLGDTVFKVFWDDEEERIRVVNVDPMRFFARWAPDDLSKLRQVAVVWRATPAELELLGLRAGGVGQVVERWTASEWSLEVDGRRARGGPNPYGFIPFVHIPNLAPPNEFWGISDLRDVIPLNRELNERMSDQADIIRYHADPPVVFRGVEGRTDLPVGPGTVWEIPPDADVKLLEWHGQPVAVQEHIERVLRAIYELSETPRTAFGDSGRLLSGVALEVELRPLIQKTLRKRTFWTAGLRRRNAMVLRLAERFGVRIPGTRARAAAGSFAPYRTRVIWPPMVPQDDTHEVANNVALVQAGLRSHRAAMAALGEQDPEAELARVAADRATVASVTPAPRSPRGPRDLGAHAAPVEEGRRSAR